MINFLGQPLRAFFIAGAILLSSLGSLSLIPDQQDPGQQAIAFEEVVITTTAQSVVVPCSQGAGSIGRKTLVVENGAESAGAITVTAELRTTRTENNFTSGYLALNGVTTNTLLSATSPATAAAGAFCQISAISANTSTITVTLRRE